MHFKYPEYRPICQANLAMPGHSFTLSFKTQNKFTRSTVDYCGTHVGLTSWTSDLELVYF